MQNWSLKELIGEVYINNSLKEKTSFCIINAQSVKIQITLKVKVMIIDKKISDIKLNVAVDMQSVYYTIYIITVDITDLRSYYKND